MLASGSLPMSSEDSASTTEVAFCLTASDRWRPARTPVTTISSAFGAALLAGLSGAGAVCASTGAAAINAIIAVE